MLSFEAFRSIDKYLNKKYAHKKGPFIFFLFHSDITSERERERERESDRPFPEFVGFGGFLNFRVAVEYVVFAFQGRAGPDVAAGEPAQLAVLEIADLDEKDHQRVINSRCLYFWYVVPRILQAVDFSFSVTRISW